MSNKANNSNIYLRLEGFIKKYYKNQIIKGSLLSISLVLAFFLLVVTLEFYGKYSGSVRLALLFTFISSTLFVITKFILVPFSALIKLSKRLSFELASIIIGNHFPEVQDKIINILQLNDINKADNSLIVASIEQKSTDLKPFDFKLVIDYKKNRKYLKFLIPIFILFASVFFIYPSIIKIGTKRILYYNTVFKNNFSFTIFLDSPLEAIVGDDYIFSFHLEGNELPKSIFIEYDNKRYKADDLNKQKYSFVFANIKKDIPFKIIADDNEYDMYSLKAIVKPSIKLVNIVAKYPQYLNMKDEVLTNPSDLTLPEGTQLSWNIIAENTNGLKVYRNNNCQILNGTPNYNFNFKALSSDIVSLIPINANTHLRIKDSLSTSINIIPDLYPSIDVKEVKDSVFISLFSFNGNIKDDYGLRLLKFNYTVYKNNIETTKNLVNIPLTLGLVSQDFNYPFDTKLLGMMPGDKLIYFFEVFDNDGVNGSKSTKSQLMTFSIPTEAEINDNINNRNENIKDDLSDSKSLADELQKQIDELQKSLLQKKELSWDDKKKLDNIMQKQDDLKNKMKEVKRQNDINDIQKNELTEEEKRLLEKQELINKLFDELNDENLDKMMDDLEKMMDKLDKNKMMDVLEKMETDNQDIEKELDRTLALFKEMQFENKLNESITKIDELIKKQEAYIKEAEDKKVEDSNLKNQQNKIDDMMNELKEDLKALDDLNNELEEKKDLEGLDEKMEEIQKEQNNSKQELDNKQKSKSSKSMNNAKGNTEEMKNQLESMQMEMEQESKEENMEDLRQLLDNTLKLSFDQEALINNTNATNVSNPQFKYILREQKKLIDDSKVIEDSLLALSKRIIEIESIVNREITQVKTSMQKSLIFLDDRNKSSSVQKQQYALTSLNNLALMLSEAIQQMQEQMKNSSQSKGNKSCKKPGSSNPNMDGLLKKQMGLQQKMQGIKEKMNGQTPKNGENGDLAKDLVKLANEQEGIRKELQGMLKDKDIEGDQKKQINDIIKKMEENESDILNKRISSQTIDRAEEIKIKMMDSDKALRKQDQDEKRKSNEGIDIPINNNQNIENYFKNKNKEVELIKFIPPIFRPYYKTKVSQYLNNF